MEQTQGRQLNAAGLSATYTDGGAAVYPAGMGGAELAAEVRKRRLKVIGIIGAIILIILIILIIAAAIAIPCALLLNKSSSSSTNSIVAGIIFFSSFVSRCLLFKIILKLKQSLLRP